MHSDWQIVKELLDRSRRVLFITGAGMSAESGIPTFRGSTSGFAGGLTEEGLPIEVALSIDMLLQNPRLSWKYFRQLELAMRGKGPNAGHRAIAALESPDRHVCVATQNIDGLHQSAGTSAVIELHGNLRRLVCTRCSYRKFETTFEGLADLPMCPNCRGMLRPDAVLYGEMLPETALETFDREMGKGFDMVFSVGTTSTFAYVSQPVVLASVRGIPTVEINPETTPVSEVVRFRFSEPAGPCLMRCVASEA